MSAQAFCNQVVRIAASEHFGWRGTLLVFQGVCFLTYVFFAWLHRGRIFVPSAMRTWDLDTAFMVLSPAAAAAGIATWGAWFDLASRKVDTQSAIDSGDFQRNAAARIPESLANAAYLFSKPLTVAFYSASQLLIALRLIDLVTIRRGARARASKRRLRIATLLAVIILNIPSFVGCWISAAA
jgi:hypothetical protein